jgi:hypothetical protein
MWSITAILLKEILDAVNHQGIRPATGISAGRGVNPKPGSAFLFCSLKINLPILQSVGNFYIIHMQSDGIAES